MTTSLKWVSAENGNLVHHNADQIFTQELRTSPINLISIFGRARQGKSFMMNCLSGEREVFRVSNEKDSCTQGIDVSSKFIGIREFSRIDGGTQLDTSSEVTSSIKIGFLDAEGQGDRDISYDSRLACPALLCSKVVLFNWKGDLQKDLLLSTLGVMTRAAQNVSLETSSSSTKKKFGHLHILFRDWQATETNPKEVHKHIFNIEPESSESSTRNQIRRDVQASFASVTVWLFDPPSEYVKDLKNKLTIDKTSEIFRSQVRALRNCITKQIQYPTDLNGHESVSTSTPSRNSFSSSKSSSMLLTGKTLPVMMKSIIETLNKGEVIMPSATYLSMMKDEVNSARNSYQKLIHEQVNKLIEDFQHKVILSQSKEESDPIEDEKKILKLYEVKIEKNLGEYINQLIYEIFGDKVNTNSSVIYDDFVSFVNSTNDKEKKRFLLEYQKIYSKWLINTRQRAEEYLDCFCSLFLNVSHLKSYKTEEQIYSALNKCYDDAISMIGGGNQSYDEYIDAKKIIDRHFQGYYEKVSQLIREEQLRIQQEREEKEKRERERLERERIERERLERERLERERIEREQQELERRKKEQEAEEFNLLRTNSEILYKEICSSIKTSISNIITQLTHENPTGFSLKLAESKLNNQYFQHIDEINHKLHSIHQTSSYYLQANELKEGILRRFKAYCVQLRPELLEKFEEVRKKVVHDIIMKVHEDLLSKLSSLVDAYDLSHSANLDEQIKKMNDIANEYYEYSLNKTSGWFDDEIKHLVTNGMSHEDARKSITFAKDIFEYINTEFIQPFTIELNEIQDIKLKKIKIAEEALAAEQRAEAHRLEQLRIAEERERERLAYEQELRERERQRQLEEEEEFRKELFKRSAPSTPIKSASVPNLSSPSKSNSRLSVSQQKKRALEWAQNNLSSPPSKISTGSKEISTPIKSATGRTQRLSVEEQKKRALEYASKHFFKKTEKPSSTSSSSSSSLSSTSEPFSSPKPAKKNNNNVLAEAKAEALAESQAAVERRAEALLKQKK